MTDTPESAPPPPAGGAPDDWAPPPSSSVPELAANTAVVATDLAALAATRSILDHAVHATSWWRDNIAQGAAVRAAAVQSEAAQPNGVLGDLVQPQLVEMARTLAASPAMAAAARTVVTMAAQRAEMERKTAELLIPSLRAAATVGAEVEASRRLLVAGVDQGTKAVLGGAAEHLSAAVYPIAQLPAWLDKGRTLAMVAPVLPLPQPMLDLAESVTTMQTHVHRQLAELGQLWVRAARAARDWGRQAYLALLTARDAAIRGDAGPVGEFFARYLDLPRRGWKQRVEAGMDVLVHARVEDYDADTVFDLLEVLDHEVNRYFTRCWRPLADTELAGRPVTSMDLLPSQRGAPEIPAEEFLPVSASSEDRAMFVLHQIQDDRLEAAVATLTPPEQRVVWAKALVRGSWQDAATACGLPETEGERVRAKLARRAKTIQAISTRPMGKPR